MCSYCERLSSLGLPLADLTLILSRYKMVLDWCDFTERGVAQEEQIIGLSARSFDSG